MSSNFGENWGQPSVDNKEGITLTTSRGEGKAFITVPPTVVKHATGTKTEVTVALKKPDGEDDSKPYSSELRFAVPRACTAFSNGSDDEDANEDPAKEMLLQVRKAIGQAGGAGATATAGGPTVESASVKLEGKSLAKFNAVPMASPAGIFNIQVTDAVVSFVEPKKNIQFTFTHAQIDKLFTFESVIDDKKYLAFGLRSPVKIGATLHSVVTVAMDFDLEIQESTPWTADITDAEIEKRYPQGSLFRATEAGNTVDLMCKVFKTILNCKLLSGTKDFKSKTRSASDQPVSGFKASFRSSLGGLYFLKDYFLYLYKPATLVLWSDVNSVAIDSTRGAETFNIVFNCKKSAHSTIKGPEEKFMFVGIVRGELHNIKTFLSEIKNLNVSCPEFDEIEDDDDDEDDEEDDDDDDDDDDEEDEDDDDDDWDDSDDDDSDAKPKHKKKKEKSKKEKSKKEKSKKEKKKKEKSKKEKSKKEKKEKSKKEKKEKHKKEKKDKKSAGGDEAVERQKRPREDEEAQ